MQPRHLYLFTLLILSGTLLLSLLWEFLFEGWVAWFLFGENESEPFAERMEYVVTVMVFVTLSLIPSVWGGLRIIARDRRRQELEQENRALVADAQRREEVQQAKKALLNRMSHELRTPLNAIMGYAQLLELALDQAQDRQGVERSQAIYRASHHLLRLIDEVLLLSRSDSPELELSQQSIALSPFIANCLEMMRPGAERAGVVLSCTTAPDITLMTDADLLRQIIHNLMANGINYNRPGGKVELHAMPDSCGWLAITISDTGEGIDEHIQPRLFEPLDKLSDDGSKPGYGLGLPIARALAERLGGELKLASSCRGSGTTFMLRLPLSATDAVVQDSTGVS